MEESLELKLRNTVDLGRKARETKQYFDGNPYFREVLDRIRFNLLRSIMDLRSTQKDEFSAMKVAYDMVNEPLTYIENDIANGERAAAELQGFKKPDDGGLL